MKTYFPLILRIKLWVNILKLSILVICDNLYFIDFPADENKNEKIKNDGSSISSTSVHNSFIDMQEIDRLQTKVARLELENQEVNKQLLNVQHLYAEVRNENVSLQSQVERINEQLTQTQMEKEQYVIRAQRILSEKEKLLSLNQANVTNEESGNTFVLYSEEIKYVHGDKFGLVKFALKNNFML